jgi:hypothetical protein
MMLDYAPVFAAFCVVFVTIAFIVYCSKEIDAEADRVKNYRL